MKQKFLIVLLTLACTLCLAFGLTACNESSANSGSTNQSGTQTENDGTSQDGNSSTDGDTDNDAVDSNADNTDNAEQGDTEQGSTETTFTYADKTFNAYSDDMTFYINDVEEWEGVAAFIGITIKTTFTFNSDGSGTIYIYQLLPSDNNFVIEETITFEYAVTECTSLDLDFKWTLDEETYTFSGSRDFTGYKIVFSNCKYTQYNMGGTDYLSSVTDEDAETVLSEFVIGYNDTGVYLYAVEGFDCDSTNMCTRYGKLAEVTN